MEHPAHIPEAAPRIADTAAGKTLAALLALFYAALATTAAGSEWHTLFLPASLLAAAMMVFCFCAVKGYKLPNPGLAGWVAAIAGGGYFFIRAAFSPWFYESLADMALVITALVMFMTGLYAGAGKGEKSLIPAVAAALGLLNAALWGFQNVAGTEASWFRPEYSLFGTETHCIGLFGYKNFSSHFLSITGFFLCAYSMARTRKWGAWLAVGVLLVAVSFTCNSRSAFPNALIGATLCFFIYTASVFNNNRKFYTAALLFILLLFFGASYVLLDLSNGEGKLAAMLDVFTFGNRTEMSNIAWSFADQAPLYGQGSQMFCNLATEFFPGTHVPNFAHHEYAQMACDYGYTGMGIMLALLLLFLLMGVRSVLGLPDERKRANPLGAAALCVLAIAAFHAYFEFIWHQPALLGAAALCGGLVCTAASRKIRTIHAAGRWVQTGAALLLAAGATWYAATAFPVWKASWQTKQHATAPLMKAVEASHDPNLTQRLILQTLQSRTAFQQEELAHLNELATQAEALSPGSHSLAAARGMLDMYRHDFASAERLLRPYVRTDRFDDRMFAWTTIYLNNLYAWCIATAAHSPNQALSMALTMEPILNTQFRQWQFYGSATHEGRVERLQRQSALKMVIRELENRGARPDDSWKQ